jgi:hypothetical protein
MSMMGVIIPKTGVKTEPGDENSFSARCVKNIWESFGFHVLYSVPKSIRSEGALSL